MGFDAYMTLGVLVLVLVFLIFTRYGADLVLLGGLTLLFTFGVLDSKDVMSGLANEGMAAVGLLYVVAVGLRETGAMQLIGERMLGRPSTLIGAQGRIMLPVGVLSAFMNNTPLVAMMLPVIRDWSKKLGIPVSKLMIPLSYASIMGGGCTLIGTSTILVVNGLIKEEGLVGYEGGLGMFEIGKVGLPCALIGVGYLLLVGVRLLPRRDSVLSIDDDARQYTVEMIVDGVGPLCGKTIEEAGLRQLPGMYLMEVDRGGQIMVAVPPMEQLEGGDRLVFVGVIESVVDLQKIRGLVPATDEVSKLDSPRPQRVLIEAVVSDSCPLVGDTIRAGRFRTAYNAVVIAVARNGYRIRKKIGDIVLEVGDTLLLEARPSFVDQQRNRRDFYLVSQIEDSHPLRHEKAWIATGILVLMVGSVALGYLSMLNAALLAAGLMIITRCCSASVAHRSVDWRVLLVIAAAFGIGRAMGKSGAAEFVSGWMLSFAGESPYVSLAVICGITMMFTNVMNANAAGVLMFPIAMNTAGSLGVDPMPFAMALLMGAVCSFATPIGYQTNLMVYGPGGYRFMDYVKVGLPLSLLVWGVSVVLVPMIWGF